MKTYGNRILVPALVLLFLASTTGISIAERPDQDEPLHADFSRLLEKYVQDHLIKYSAWVANAQDIAALGQYVDQMAGLDPAEWQDADALTYWINLYNAVTLRLVLDHYPLKSIKDLGGFMKSSPWKRELVTVGGRALALNDIENDIIRPRFGDPRIHFALNCASVGCPPLGKEAYFPGRLSEQLDAACGWAMNHDQWVCLDGDKLLLTKIFDWYGEDFAADGGSVLAFIKRYRTEPLPEGDPKIDFMSYDWSLNEAP
jgi:hypothetical protein